MPASVVKNKRDERLWDRAKVLATKQGHDGDYDYVMGVYKRMTGMSKGLGPFQSKLQSLAQPHPFGGIEQGQLPRHKMPKHAPGMGWVPIGDGTGGWMRPTSRGVEFVEVWYPEHDHIIDIGQAAELPYVEEYYRPDLCGTIAIELVETRKHEGFADTNEEVAMEKRWSVKQSNAILAIVGLQLDLADLHEDNARSMVEKIKSPSSLLTGRF
jgi:hypothetical protein